MQAHQPLKELDELYSGNLAKLEDEATQSGRLQQVLAIQAEIKGFREGTSPEAPEDFPGLRRFQGIYRAERAKRLAAVGEAVRPIHEGYRRKLVELQTRLTQERKIEEAVAVSEAIAEVEASLAAEALSMPKEAAPAVSVGSGEGKGDGITFTEGRLFAVGRMAKDTPIDLSPAEGISDFVDVTGNSYTWVALRKNGAVVGWNRSTGAFSASGIRQLVPTPIHAGSLYGVTTTGNLIDLQSGETIPGIGSVKEAAVGAGHGIALLEDGKVRVWGELYETKIRENEPLPKPPEAALRDAVAVAATTYSAWVVNREGKLVGWGPSGKVFDKFPREIRDVTRIWGEAHSVCVETKGKNILRLSSGNPEQSHAVDGNPSVIRTGRSVTIQFEGNRWKQTTNRKDEHGEWAALTKLDGSHWPFGFMHADSGRNTSYLLWLSADEPPQAGR